MIVALVAATSPIAAYAKLIGTDEVVAAQSFGYHDRAQLAAALDRADVAAMLEQHGVTVEQAKARLAAMTEAEVNQLAATMDSAPAGAGIIGVLFTVFVILLVTDIFGFTKIFPFTRPIR
ncbi:MAG: PA2779 family protein [Burkholderiaceae bacterium]|nr:PA2779 family protein [Burkholderiaceae bacterium]